MSKPSDKHRSWAEMVRTAAAVATLLLTAGLALEKLGVW